MSFCKRATTNVLSAAPDLLSYSHNAPPALAGAGADTYQALDDPQLQAQFSRPTAQPHEVESWLVVEGMVCASCAQIIEQHLRGMPGVVSVSVNAVAGRARLVWDSQLTSVSALFKAIAALGYRPFPVQRIVDDLQRRDERRRALWRLFVAGFCMMQVMMYAAPAYFASPGEITPDMESLLNWASWVLSLPVMLFAATPFFSNAWRDLLARRVGMDMPVALGIAITFCASTAALLHRGGAVYFDSLTMFVFFLLGGRYLETLARTRVAASLESLSNRLPQTVERFVALSRVHAKRIPRWRISWPVATCCASQWARLFRGMVSLSRGALPWTKRC